MEKVTRGKDTRANISFAKKDGAYVNPSVSQKRLCEIRKKLQKLFDEKRQAEEIDFDL